MTEVRSFSRDLQSFGEIHEQLTMLNYFHIQFSDFLKEEQQINQLQMPISTQTSVFYL